jgi:predicted SAM-dependent methyltransferase
VPISLRSIEQAVRRDGWAAALDRGWERACQGLCRLRLSHLLGRLRNLWRLPRLRRQHEGGRLNLGCGPDWREGFLNADLGLRGEVHLDVGRRFPLPDGWFSLIFSEHLLEHLTERQAATCLAECHRVLQPGRVLRLSTPDLQYVVECYQSKGEAGLAHLRDTAAASPWKYAPEELPSPAQALNDGFYLWEHRHLYDEEELRRVLAAAGFADLVIRSQAAQGEQAAALESRTRGSLVAEARKAPAD